MKVTIDSTEPLADAIRVIGALYNVNLAQVAATDEATTSGAAKDQSARPGIAKPSRRRRPKTSQVASPRGSGRGRPKSTADSREVRAWAVANGHSVSNRGTLPAAIKSAYAKAHEG